MTKPSPTAWRRLRRRVRDALGIRDPEPLGMGLRRINDRLGLHGTRPVADRRKAATVRIERTAARPRSVSFAPDLDGQADSGEVVWVWVPGDAPTAPPQERAILVIGRTRTTVFGLLISPNPDHATEEWWLEIGAGEWDERGRQCWVRLDRVLEVPEEQIRRQGTLFPPRRFERIANRLRSVYHWA